MNTLRAQIWRALCFSILFCNFSFGQATVNVRVLTVEVLNNVDCDGLFTGDSDFVWEFLATDNTIGNSNNNPVLFGILGDFNYAYQNGNNGPYVMTAPGSGFSPNSGWFFTHDYVCAADVPTQVTIDWRAYENDEATNYSLLGLLTDGETANQSVTMAVPTSPGVNWQTFTASSTDAGCNQTYRVTFEVEYVGLTIQEVPDDICNAIQIPVGPSQIFGLCSGATLEPNEPNTSDVTTNGSAWFYFVAPPSGSVNITTDLAGTQVGTYFEIYHAADGVGCIEGVQPVTGTVIKNKFDYLSHIQFSDGIDLLGADPEAEIVLDACNPVAPFSYQKLIAGEVYYVQLALDAGEPSGYVEIGVFDQGGSSGDLEDIPCQSPTTTFGTTVISSANGDPATINLQFGCAFDSGNNYGETGAAHTSANPDEYHAYDYDHNAANNGTINETVWFNFVAPNSGRIVFESDYQSAVYSEDNAFWGQDIRFSPGIPSDYSCADLENLGAQEGGVNGVFGGGSESAIITKQCLEPGYTYYGMVDPSNSLTNLSAQNIDSWLYDPSVADPTNNPPGNDILCLTIPDPIYEVVVTPAGNIPPFQAVAGSNEKACREYLAGEPPVIANQNLRADQTVWHYFTVPASGAIEMNLRAYIGMDTLRYSVYELLNGTDCYGGLNPATFTTDGTQTTPIITPVLQGSATFNGTQESICCLMPGSVYAIQLDGGYPGDEGQYIIEYIREVEAYAGDTYVATSYGDTTTYNSTDTAFVCFNDTLFPGNLINGIGQPTIDIPSCLDPGFVLHSNPTIPTPVTGSGFTYIDTIHGLSGGFVNDTDGSGSFGNPAYNTVYYVSSMADEPATWGDFTCNTSTVDNSVNVVFLEPVNPVSSYDNALCEMNFTSSGGLSSFYGTDINYTIQDASANVVLQGTFTPGTNVNYAVASAEIYTVTIDDGACPYSFTIDASACSNPCIVSPIIVFVDDTICNGQTIFLGGANQTTAGVYTDVFPAANGCDSTVYTTLVVNEPAVFEQTVTICQGTTFTVGANTYSTPGVYLDTFVATNGCDSIVTTNLFLENTINVNIAETICTGTSYNFGGTAYSASGVYVDSLIATQGGCDSVVTLYLTVEPLISTSTSQTICQGTSINFGTQTLSTSGTYTEQFTTVSGGCDSLVTMYLFVNPIIETSISEVICQGQNYVLGAQTLTATGEYTENFTTATGCDSLVRLFLTVTPQLNSTYSDTICLGETYTHGTQTLTTSGIYDEMFVTTSGCDSLVTLELIVQDCQALLEISNICTPNNDGSNDTWKVSDLNQIKGCTVKIFNRWGQLVYETTDYQNDWEGTKDGEILPDGVYYYAITCGEDREYQGVINLMRFKK